MSRARRFAAALAGAAALGVGLVMLAGPPLAERALNGVRRAGPYSASGRARALHARLEVADLHADSLLWGRDLNLRGTRGQVDVPRLIEANVALQGFFLVTHTPRGLNIHSNSAETLDTTTLLALAQRWPVATWRSRKARALHQAARLRAIAGASGGRLTVVRSRGDLVEYRARRARQGALTAAFLGVEGAHCLDGEVAALDELFAAGVRVVAPTHFFDTFLGGSSSGEAKGGLTEAGRAFVKGAEARRMIIDLAHASPALIRDVLSIATRPVLVSHTGVRGTCDNARNLSDEELRGVARTGGVAGIAFFDTATCGEELDAVVRAIRHAIAVAGEDHVSLGSDHDGAVTTATDVTGLVQLTESLLDAGLAEATIAKVMGGNAMKLFAEQLP